MGWPQFLAWAATQGFKNIKLLRQAYNSFKGKLPSNQVILKTAKNLLDDVIKKTSTKDLAAKVRQGYKKRPFPGFKPEIVPKVVKPKLKIEKSKQIIEGMKPKEGIANIGDRIIKQMQKEGKTVKFDDLLRIYGKKPHVSGGQKLYLKKTGLDQGKVIDLIKKPPGKAEGGIAELLGEPRSGYQGGGSATKTNALIKELYDAAGGFDGTGKSFTQFMADVLFEGDYLSRAEGGRIGLAGGMSPKQIENKKRKLYFDLGRDDFMNMFEYLQSEQSARDLEGAYKEGGRIGYDNGGPVFDIDLYNQLIAEGVPKDQAYNQASGGLGSAMQEEFDKIFGKAQGGRIGFQDGRGIMSRVGDMVDIRNVPYYSGKALQGLVNSAETLSKFPFAAGKLTSDLIQKPGFKKIPSETSDDPLQGTFLNPGDYRLEPTEVWGEALENITPGSWSENLGLTSLVEGMGEKRPKDAQTVGGILGLGTEIAVPTGGAFKAGQLLLSKASKAMGKVKDGKTLNKLVEDKISDSGQSRRDFMSLVGASGLAAGLKWLGLGGLLKGATKKLDDIEIQVRGDADYEYIDEAWSGGTWANVYFKALTKKGKDILEKLTKGKDSFFTKQKTTTSMDNIDELYIPGNSEEAAVAVEKIIAGHKPNWRLNTATKQIYNKKTKSFSHPKDSIEGAYEHSKNYSGKDLNKKTIMKEADDLIASERSPYHRGIEVHDEFLDDILNQITTKKAEGGRIGLGAGGPPIQLGIAESKWQAMHPVQGNKISQLKDAAMDRAFPGTGITGSLNMGNFEAFYNQPLIDPMNMFEKSQQPQYGLQYEKGPFSAGVGVMPSGETEYGFKLRKEFNDGGLTKTVPPKRGPMPQGLPSALYNGIMRPRSY